MSLNNLLLRLGRRHGLGWWRPVARTINLAARRKVTAAVAERNPAAGRRERVYILNELCATTGLLDDLRPFVAMKFASLAAVH
jgi:hypothetical protein